MQYDSTELSERRILRSFHYLPSSVSFEYHSRETDDEPVRIHPMNSALTSLACREITLILRSAAVVVPGGGLRGGYIGRSVVVVSVEGGVVLSTGGWSRVGTRIGRFVISAMYPSQR